MGTQYQSLITWACLPDTTGGFYFEPYTIKATNDAWGRRVGIAQDVASNVGFHGGLKIPGDYASAPSILVAYTAVVTSGSFVFGINYRSASQGESLDQSTGMESPSVIGGAPTSVNLLQVSSIDVTAGNFSAGKELEFNWYRAGNHASDTAASAAIIFGVYLGYQT